MKKQKTESLYVEGRETRCGAIPEVIEARIETGAIVGGCLHILDMASHSLAEVEGCNDIRGSLQHCRSMLQLLLPPEAFSGVFPEE